MERDDQRLMVIASGALITENSSLPKFSVWMELLVSLRLS